MSRFFDKLHVDVYWRQSFKTPNFFFNSQISYIFSELHRFECLGYQVGLFYGIESCMSSQFRSSLIIPENYLQRHEKKNKWTICIYQKADNKSWFWTKRMKFLAKTLN